MVGDRDEGTTGSLGDSRATRPSARCACTRVVSKTRSNSPTEPVTGTSSPSAEVAPTESPVDVNQDRVARNAPGVGPKVSAR